MEAEQEAYTVGPGEVTTPPIRPKEGVRFVDYEHTGEDAVVFTSLHSIADVLRYLICESDYEEVLTTLEMMGPSKPNHNTD